MADRQTGVVVIGAGPGGYAAAFAAADRGLNVVLVDADPQPGGVCLNRGCIPSKTLLHVARLIAEAEDAKRWGITFGKPEIDLDTLRDWKNKVIDKSAGGIRTLAGRRKIEIVRAWARFESSTTLSLSSEKGGRPDQGTLTFEHAIIATGSRPTAISALDIDSDRVMDSTAALELKNIPKSLLVVGGGYIGLETGTFHAALGSHVTVVEMTDGLLPGADRDLVRVAQVRFRKIFKEILLKTEVVEMTDIGEAVSVKLETADGQQRSETFDRVLVAVGRKPNSEGLSLENTQAKIDASGFIEVNNKRQTADTHIYAIGDVVGEPMLAHKASHEARVVAEVIAGDRATFDVRAIPAVVFTDPEIAWAGLTETEARTAGMDITVGKFPWGASGRASAIGRNDGLTKIICASDSKRILGVGIVGVGAGEMIAEAVVAIEMGATADDLARCIHPHPTLSETIMEAAEAAFGTTTHFAPNPASRSAKKG